MSKRHTLIESSKLDPHTYLIVIGTDMGEFSGVVECREEDYANESEYFGFELAEIKAEIQYARTKRKEFSAQLRIMHQFWGDMSKTRTYDIDDFWVKKMISMLDDLEHKKKFWIDREEYLKKAYHLKITTFDAFNAKRNRCREYNND